MEETDDILKFAEFLIHEETQTYCSELQRQILITTLQEERKTYDQLAEECGYSPKYVKQDVAPKLWRLLSDVLGIKVTKANARAVLAQSMRNSLLSNAVLIGSTAFSRRRASLNGAAMAEMTAGSEISASKATILLVDDQPQNLYLLSELLEEQGYDVQQAINGHVALAAIAQHPPDLVLLDVYMPQIDGYGVCQQIKSNPATEDIPVIFISALNEAWDKVRAFSAGGSDYITKPFKVVEVLARVENQLKIRQLQQTLKENNMRLQQAISELQRLAAIDELTQVASRRRFDAYLLQCWKVATSQNTALGLMFIQLDNASLYPEGIRENADAQAGDRMLQRLARLIQTTVQGPEKLVCRYGTLTFAVVLPQLAPTESIVTVDVQSADGREAGLASGSDCSSVSTARGASLEGTSLEGASLESGAIAIETLVQDIDQNQHIDDETVSIAAEKIATQLLTQAKKLLSEALQPATLSIGIVTKQPAADVPMEALLSMGDFNLQQANALGENCVVASIWERQPAERPEAQSGAQSQDQSAEQPAASQSVDQID